jgi:hypothetical protein
MFPLIFGNRAASFMPDGGSGKLICAECIKNRGYAVFLSPKPGGGEVGFVFAARAFPYRLSNDFFPGKALADSRLVGAFAF